MSYGIEKRAEKELKEYLNLPKDIQKAFELLNARREVTQREQLHCSSWPDIVKEVKKFAKKWGKQVDDVSLEHDKQSYEYDGSEYSVLYMCVDSLETDDQYYARIAVNYRDTKTIEEYDRKEFERLKAKFK